MQKSHDRSERRKGDPAFIRQFPELVESDPSNSIWNLAAQLNVGYQSIIDTIREDLRYYSYTLEVRQLLTYPMKAKRLTKYNPLLSSLKLEEFDELRFFSDENILTVDASLTRRSNRWLAQDPTDVSIVMTTK